ncbi:probable cytochrome P450 308a1 [Scaptodrosophila lebanonensis]|uniref:Probable cytochrome P450 308a1 n=1 Tax=Drosophila lebanonensis TaxID=7225 RepID=A0A6J2U263_DROLE|nr:probable cytochrome P450 308a1 [Scaptodrosophila lebanonensis]
MTALLLFLVSVAIALIGAGIGRHYSYWRRRSVSGPRPGWLLCGSLSDFVRGRQSYGDIYVQLYKSWRTWRYVGIYRLFNEPAILVRDQEMLRELLIGHFSHCADNAVCVDAKRDAIVSHNPFIASGEHWRKMRSELMPLFTPRRLRQTLPHIGAACAQLRDYVEQYLPGERFEAKDLATRYTLQVVASVVFGLDAKCFEPRQNGEMEGEWFSLLGPLFQPNPLSLLETIALLHSPTIGRILGYRYMPLNLQHWLSRIVKQLLQSCIGRQIDGNASFIQSLVDARQRANLPVDVKTIIGHCSTLLLEGYETSASLLAFALYELARHEPAQQRLQADIDALSAKNDGQLHRPEALTSLAYAEATLYETLRLHPAMSTLQKRCTKPFVLPSQNPEGRSFFQEVAGPEAEYTEANRDTQEVHIPVGMVFVIPVQAIHHDPMIYPEPQLFQPERFLSQAPLGCRFLGFGEGPRMCPGMRFGLAQTQAALVTLLQDYSVRLAEGESSSPVEHSPVTFLTASKEGIWLRLEPR